MPSLEFELLKFWSEALTEEEEKATGYAAEKNTVNRCETLTPEVCQTIG